MWSTRLPVCPRSRTRSSSSPGRSSTWSWWWSWLRPSSGSSRSVDFLATENPGSCSRATSAVCWWRPSAAAPTTSPSTLPSLRPTLAEEPSRSTTSLKLKPRARWTLAWLEPSASASGSTSFQRRGRPGRSSSSVGPSKPGSSASGSPRPSGSWRRAASSRPVPSCRRFSVGVGKNLESNVWNLSNFFASTILSRRFQPTLALMRRPFLSTFRHFPATLHSSARRRQRRRRLRQGSASPERLWQEQRRPKLKRKLSFETWRQKFWVYFDFFPEYSSIQTSLIQVLVSIFSKIWPWCHFTASNFQSVERTHNLKEAPID